VATHTKHVGTNNRQEPSRAQWLRRLASRRRDSNTVAFVFSGGGPLGALQVGALQALFEHDIRPDLVVGTSVGALNATFLAFDPTPQGVESIKDLWTGFRDQDLFPGGRFRATWARVLTKGNHLFENSGIRRVISNRIGEAAIEDTQIPLGIVATDIETGAERLFQSGRALEPLLASTAMPSIFPPVEIDGRTYIDGGVSNNVPIAHAVAMGAKTIYVMDSTSHSHQRRPLVRPMDYLLHAFSLARAQRLEVERRWFEERVNLVMLPSPVLDFFVPFASMEHTRRLIDMSYETVSGALSKSGPSSDDEPRKVQAIYGR
jgi:NTE family protein